MREILSSAQSKGIECAIVGGTPRDYYLGLPCKPDFDIEYRGDTSELKSILEHFEVLKYEVLRFKDSEFEAEFSLPRVEKFEENFSHSNFIASFDADLSYEKAAHRRDFTVNAIYWKYADGHFEVVDPLDGVFHLKEKRLVPCSKDFSKDPVRYLRGLRFSILFDFDFTQKVPDKIKDEFKEPFYFVSEANKSQKILKFISRFLGLIESPLKNEVEKAIDCGLEVSSIQEIKNYWFLSNELKNFLLHHTGIKVQSKPKLIKLSIEDLDSQASLTNEVLSFLEGVSKLSKSEYKFIYSMNLIDYSFAEFQAICAIEVDLDLVENKKRRQFRWAQRLKLS